MESRLSLLDSGETKNKAHQSVRVKGADQNASNGSDGPHRQRRKHFSVLDAPYFLLQFLDGAHLRKVCNVTYFDARMTHICRHAAIISIVRTLAADERR